SSPARLDGTSPPLPYGVRITTAAAGSVSGKVISAARLMPSRTGMRTLKRRRGATECGTTAPSMPAGVERETGLEPAASSLEGSSSRCERHRVDDLGEEERAGRQIPGKARGGRPAVQWSGPCGRLPGAGDDKASSYGGNRVARWLCTSSTN